MYKSKKKYSFLLFLELFLLMPYQYIKIIPNVYDITVYLKYAFLLYELFLCTDYVNFKEVQLRKFGPMELSFIGYILYMVSISVIRSSTSFTNITSFFVTLLLSMLVIRRNMLTDYERTINTVSLYFFIAIVVNGISVLLFPQGLYTTLDRSGKTNINYFLGLDNSFGMILFPGATFCIFNSELQKKGRRVVPIVVIIMLISSYFISMSGAGLIATMAFVVLFILYKLKLFEKLITLKIIIPVVIFLSIFLIVGNPTLYGNTQLSMFITSFLGKDITFSSRTLIWVKALESFLENPFFGYGKIASDNVVYIWGTTMAAHNFWLQLALEGGLICIVLYLLFIKSMNSIKKISENTIPELRIFDIGIFATMIYLLMESGFSIVPVSILFLVMGYTSKALSVQNYRCT